MTLQIGNLDAPDLLVRLNNAAVPDVNQLDEKKADWLVTHARWARVASLDGNAAGAIIVLDDRAAFESEYFTWFTARYRNFLYIDRVVVAAWARRRGVAAELYREIDGVAGERGMAIAAEVYCEPPNTASLAFHVRMGYREIGRQVSRAEGKTVSKLMKFAERAERI